LVLAVLASCLYAQQPTCQNLLDIVFVVDGSSSISGDAFADTKAFITEFSKPLPFDIVKQPSRVSIVQISEQKKTRLEVPLTGNRKVIEKGKQSLRQLGGSSTDVARGLSIAYKQLSTTVNLDHRRVVVLVTDGHSSDNDKSIIEANRLKKDLNATIFTVGVGPRVDVSNLDKLASEPISATSFHVALLKNPSVVVQNIISQSCKGSHVIIPTGSPSPSTSTPTIIPTIVPTTKSKIVIPPGGTLPPVLTQPPTIKPSGHSVLSLTQSHSSTKEKLRQLRLKREEHVSLTQSHSSTKQKLRQLRLKREKRAEKKGHSSIREKLRQLRLKREKRAEKKAERKRAAAKKKAERKAAAKQSRKLRAERRERKQQRKARLSKLTTIEKQLDKEESEEKKKQLEFEKAQLQKEEALYKTQIAQEKKQRAERKAKRVAEIKLKKEKAAERKKKAAERKAKKAAEKKAKKAERKKKAAEKRAKRNAEKKAKKEQRKKKAAERKAKKAAEKKAKKEQREKKAAEKKAKDAVQQKASAERKAKKTAEKKAKEAKEQAALSAELAAKKKKAAERAIQRKARVEQRKKIAAERKVKKAAQKKAKVELRKKQAAERKAKRAAEKVQIKTHQCKCPKLFPIKRLCGESGRKYASECHAKCRGDKLVKCPDCRATKPPHVCNKPDVVYQVGAEFVEKCKPVTTSAATTTGAPTTTEQPSAVVGVLSAQEQASDSSVTEECKFAKTSENAKQQVCRTANHKCTGADCKTTFGDWKADGNVLYHELALNNNFITQECKFTKRAANAKQQVCRTANHECTGAKCRTSFGKWKAQGNILYHH